MSIFLYAYTLADAPHDLEDLTGVEGRNLFMVTCGNVSAIVSAYGQKTLSLSGDDIFAHQHAQRLLMSQASILPLQYGLTLSSLSQVEKVLTNNEEVLEKELNRIYRKVEMEVTMRFDVPDLLDHLISKYPYLRDEKGKVLNGRLLYYLGDRAKKGEKFTRTLAKEKEIYKSQFKEMVGPWCAEIRESHLPLSEMDVVTFNCLVNRERLRVFEKSIYDAGDRFAPDFTFSYNGPWAPQNFCSQAMISYK
ncbi:GvpL/GvpF family gas vesicle protein [Pelagicoccus albus]|uniref:GvpL/GvpF family gas vesicle protein n=1 Tax=Pelagicoccus albus TaxID=415222 RepID=A0A7X1B3D0_9BACT|nr:GvpL/GvpF family gas vesicle protein [Pelagicoccus albus]MBC2604898.1 GvpL/GvpF family gas vesicle protein [Pelagicoccus albus]